MRVRGASLIWAVVAGVAAVRPVRAEPPGDAVLTWRAPGGCPDAAEIRARIERRLGAPLGSVVRSVAVDIADRGDGQAPRFEARVDLRGSSASALDDASEDQIRVLTSDRCDEVADAVAVIIARLAAEHRTPPADDPPRREFPPAADAIRDPSGERVAAPAGPSLVGAGLRATAVSAIGAQPGISVGGELAGNLRVRSAMLELAGMRWRSTSQVLHSGAPGQLDVNLRATALRLGWSPERIPLRGWLSGELGTLRGEGVAIAASAAGSVRWMAIGGGFAVAWAMGSRVRLIGAIDVAVAMRRARFVLRDGSEVYRSGWVTVRSGVGLEIGWR